MGRKSKERKKGQQENMKKLWSTESTVWTDHAADDLKKKALAPE